MKTCYVIPMDEISGPLNMCTKFEVNRCNIDTYKNMRKSNFLWRHVTQKRYVVVKTTPGSKLWLKQGFHGFKAPSGLD